MREKEVKLYFGEAKSPFLSLSCYINMQEFVMMDRTITEDITEDYLVKVPKQH